MTCALCGGAPHASVTARWALPIDRDIPSQNVLATNSGPSRWRYRRERDAWILLFRNAKQLAKVTDARCKRRVIIERRFSGRQRLYDHANLVGGAKSAVDAMVRTGLLVDDSPQWLEAYYRQDRADDCGRRTVVTIEELA